MVQIIVSYISPTSSGSAEVSFVVAYVTHKHDVEEAGSSNAAADDILCACVVCGA